MRLLYDQPQVGDNQTQGAGKSVAKSLDKQETPEGAGILPAGVAPRASWSTASVKVFTVAGAPEVVAARLCCLADFGKEIRTVIRSCPA